MASSIPGIRFVDYEDESQLHQVMDLVGRDLSEPYSIFTYRYFLYRFPRLCILAVPEDSDEPIGCVVGKMDREDRSIFPGGGIGDDESVENQASSTTQQQQQQQEQGDPTTAETNATTHDEAINNNNNNMTSQADWTGYIGMLAVRESYRRKGIGKALVRQVLQRMKSMNCTSATLETEVTNVTAQKLYQTCFGFVREELLVRYYLNWNDAYRLRLWFHDVKMTNRRRLEKDRNLPGEPVVSKS